MSGTLYHGTRRGFQKGGLLLPRSAHGGAGTSAPLLPGKRSPDVARDLVYMTGSLDLAWVYAWMAPGRGKPKVLVVVPLGSVELDPEHSPDMDAWRAEAARVVDVLYVPTITEQQAREGWIR